MTIKKPINQLNHYELQCEFERIKKDISDFMKLNEDQRIEDLTIEQMKTRVQDMHRIFIQDQAYMTGLVDMASEKKLKNEELISLKLMVDELVKNIESLQNVM